VHEGVGPLTLLMRAGYEIGVKVTGAKVEGAGVASALLEMTLRQDGKTIRYVKGIHPYGADDVEYLAWHAVQQLLKPRAQVSSVTVSTGSFDLPVVGSTPT
jgi:hypothetical protein